MQVGAIGNKPSLCKLCGADLDGNAITYFCYWRRGVPIPKGCRPHDSLEGTHHGQHAILVERMAK